MLSSGSIRALKSSSDGYSVTATYQRTLWRRSHPPKTQKKLLAAVSKEQLDILTNHCHRERDKALLSFLWYSGVRVGEAARLELRISIGKKGL